MAASAALSWRLPDLKEFRNKPPTNVLQFSPARKKSWLVSMMDGTPAPRLLDVSVLTTDRVHFPAQRSRQVVQLLSAKIGKADMFLGQTMSFAFGWQHMTLMPERRRYPRFTSWLPLRLTAVAGKIEPSTVNWLTQNISKAGVGGHS